MNIERINILLEKYWNCETTVQEENELQLYFNSPNVSDDLQHLIPIFAYRKKMQSNATSEMFESKLEVLLNENKKQDKYIVIKLFQPLLKIVASVAIIAVIGATIFYFIQKDNQNFTETYNDPEIAIQQAVLALQKLSTSIQLTEDASIKSLEQLDELNISWSEIDSLSSDSLFNGVIKPENN